MAETEIIAYHGWGFDGKCWQSWQKMIPNTVCWKNFYRGYFNNSHAPYFSDQSASKIVITHSFGLNLCCDEIIQQADLLVIISGFLCFHPRNAQLRRRSTAVLKKMINQFEKQPQPVLRTFYRNVFSPDEEYWLPPHQINKSLLLDDLKWLHNAYRSFPVLKKSAKVCIFHGEKDAIVSSQEGRTLADRFGERGQYFEIENAGHALPVTHARICRNIINTEIPELIF